MVLRARLPTLALVLLSASFAVRAGAATIVVNTASAAVANDGACSLREALASAANNTASGAATGECAAGQSPQLDTVAFAIPGAGVHTIHVAGAGGDLTVGSDVIVDGTTQPGASCSTWPPTLLIEIDGTSALEGGLNLVGQNATVRGLVVNRAVFGGFSFDSAAAFNRIQCNVVGPDPSGMSGYPSKMSRSIVLDGAHDNVIGTDGDGVNDANEGNLLTDTAELGVRLENGAYNNRIAGNRIGGDISGGGLLHVSYAISVTSGATNNIIGSNLDGTSDALEGNLVRYADRGSAVAFWNVFGSGNAVRRNSFGPSAGAGIDYAGGADGDGVTANDEPDVDGVQNWPTLTALTSTSDHTVTGTLTSQASKTLRLEFYSSNACAPTVHGPGETYLSTTLVTTDAAGAASFSVPLGPLAFGFVTATATDTASGAGNTSEFSNCLGVLPPVIVVDAGPVPTRPDASVPVAGEDASVPDASSGAGGAPGTADAGAGGAVAATGGAPSVEPPLDAGPDGSDNRRPNRRRDSEGCACRMSAPRRSADSLPVAGVVGVLGALGVLGVRRRRSGAARARSSR